MKRDDAVVTLNKLKSELIKRLGIKQLSLFGSTARDEAYKDSDIDILVFNFIWKITLAVQLVDLVIDKAVRPELRPFIKREAIRI